MKSTIYYADGTTFEGLPADAPTELVVCIPCPPKEPLPSDPPGTFHRWTLCRERNFYLYLDPPEGSWRQRGWWGVDTELDLVQHLKLANLAKGEVKAVLTGVQMDFRKYQDIILQAERDFGMTRA